MQEIVVGRALVPTILIIVGSQLIIQVNGSPSKAEFPDGISVDMLLLALYL